MRFVKRSVCSISAPYALGAVNLDGEPHAVGATEDHGPIMLMNPPSWEAHEIVAGPGGCMALREDPAQPGSLYAIMGCFPGFKFQKAGIYRIRREPGRNTPTGTKAPADWSATRILDLPFAHRIELVNRPSGRYLLAASLAADKADAADWSKPGALYAARVPADGELDSPKAWKLEPVLEGIHKNHGLIVATLQGRRTALVSGSEGLFAIDLDAEGAEWRSGKILDREVSEIAVFDVDGDGKEELITVEPFHGNALHVYKTTSRGWKSVWEYELAFGHCLWAGSLGEKGSVLVSNRAASRDLVLCQFPHTDSRAGARRALKPECIVVEANAGAANMIVLHSGNTDHIFATNQTHSEIAVYDVAP